MGYKLDHALFLQLNHPAELHFLADIYNWDDDLIVLDWVIESPLCTRATACLLFWRASPDYYRKYDLEKLSDCPKHDLEVFTLIKKILLRCNQPSFSAFQIAYDPTPYVGYRETQNPKWDIPLFLCEKIEGVALIIEK